MQETLKEVKAKRRTAIKNGKKALVFSSISPFWNMEWTELVSCVKLINESRYGYLFFMNVSEYILLCE